MKTDAETESSRTYATKRHDSARLICAYMHSQNKIRAVVTSRDIARYHNLSRQASQSISATLNFLYSNGIRDSRFGFYVMGTAPYKKCDYPHHYPIELIDEEPGLP